MKKILLAILIIIIILSINVLAVDIDIGCPAIDRASYLAGPRTVINKGNPANATGIITTVEIYAYANLTDCEVTTFYEGTANRLTTRDYEAIGTVTSGSKQTFMVSLNVQTGDYLGIFYQSGSIERDTSGGVGLWYIDSDQIPCDTYLFTLGATWVASLYGYSAPVGWPHKWNTQSITKWDTKEFTKWNGLE